MRAPGTCCWWLPGRDRGQGGNTGLLHPALCFLGVLGVRRLFVCAEEQNPGVVGSLRSCRAAGSEGELQPGHPAAALPPSGAPYTPHSTVPGLNWGLRADGAPEPHVASSQLSSGTAKPPARRQEPPRLPKTRRICSAHKPRLISARPYSRSRRVLAVLTGMLAVPPAPNLAPASKPPSTSTVEPGGYTGPTG